LSTGEPKEDTSFSTEFMPCNTEFGGAPEDLPKVLKRNFTAYNEECNYAINVQDNIPPQQQSGAYFHNYYGADTLPELLDVDGRGVTYTDSDFQSTLHKGAL